VGFGVLSAWSQELQLLRFDEDWLSERGKKKFSSPAWANGGGVICPCRA
jgi:hypothetical protein